MKLRLQKGDGPPLQLEHILNLADDRFRASYVRLLTEFGLLNSRKGRSKSERKVKRTVKLATL
jgi:hypothetical protein